MKKESVDTVWRTSDYGAFRKLEKNRSVMSRRVERLIESFKGGIVKNPIIVNEKMEIIDGQGRFEARKRLGLPIDFIIDRGKGIEDCRRMNSYNTSWQLRDFVISYAADGNENYIRLQKVAETTGTSVNDLLRYCNRTSRAANDKEDVVRTGKLIFTKEDMDKSELAVLMIEEIVDALALTRRTSSAFRVAVCIMRDTVNYNHDRMIRNCKACRHSFAMAGDLEGALKEFSRIYNYRARSNEAKIYFEDYMRNRGYNARNYDNSVFANNGEDVSSLT